MKPKHIFPRHDWTQVNITDHKELLNGEERRNWLNILENKYKTKIFGGYLENRYFLFDNKHCPEGDTHLGVDFWVEAGAEVNCPVYGEICYIGPSENTEFSWGGRIDIETEDRVFIFGHMGPMYHRLGNRVTSSYYLGKLGDRNENGGWRPHLHLQCVSKEYYNQFSNPRDIDAYGDVKDGFLHENFFDPMEYET